MRNEEGTVNIRPGFQVTHPAAVDSHHVDLVLVEAGNNLISENNTVEQKLTLQSNPILTNLVTVIH